MFTLKNFVVIVVTALLCLFIKTVPVLAANTIDTLTTSTSLTSDIHHDAEIINYSIHAPPKENLDKNSVISEHFDNSQLRITLTVEDDVVVETFYPVEEDDRLFEKKEPDYSDDDVAFMIPLITQDKLTDTARDSEVVLALGLSVVDFPHYENSDTVAQYGFMWFF